MIPFGLFQAPASLHGFSKIVALLIFMLRTMSGPAANKSIYANNIEEIGDDKVIVEAINQGSGMRFFTRALC